MKTSFSMGRALGDGLALIVRRPVAVLLWGLLMGLPTVVGFGAFWPMMDAGMLNTAGVDNGLDWEAIMALNAWSGLSNLLSLVVTAVIGAAIIRVTLDPRAGAAGGMRLGVAEFYYILVQIVIVVGLCLAMALIVGLGIALSVALRSLPDGPRIAAWVLLWLVVLLAVLWLWARTGLISVISVERRELAFEAGWAATRGQATKLAVMGVISLILCLVIFSLIMAVAALPLIGLGVLGDWSDWTDWDHAMDLAEVGAGTWAALAVVAFGMVVAAGAATAVAYAPWASAWRQMAAGRSGDLTQAS